jgi:hypothetical protein
MENKEDMSEINLEKALSIWWSMAWRAVLVSMLVGIILGFIGGFIVGMAGSPELGGVVGGLLGWLGSIPVSKWALKAALSKKHGGYSVVLVKHS